MGEGVCAYHRTLEAHSLASINVNGHGITRTTAGGTRNGRLCVTRSSKPGHSHSTSGASFGWWLLADLVRPLIFVAPQRRSFGPT